MHTGAASKIILRCKKRLGTWSYKLKTGQTTTVRCPKSNVVCVDPRYLLLGDPTKTWME